MIKRAVAIALLMTSPSALARDEASCRKLNVDGNDSGVRIPGSDAVYQVIGTGRLQFYSAPDLGCKIPGVFIIPGDRVIAYVEYNRYTAVLYINSKGHSEALGWVASSRLLATGLGIAPRQ